MKKLLLSVFTMVCVCAYALAGEYTIVFSSSTGTSDKTNDFSGAIDELLSEGTDFVESYSDLSKVYQAKKDWGIKFSSSKANGTITLNLTAAGAQKITQITASVAKYGNDASSLDINGQTQSITSSAFEDYNFNFTPTEATTQLVLTATKRIYLNSLTVTYEGGSTAEELTKPSIELGEHNTVTILQAEESPVYYTLDGTTPDVNSTMYKGPFQISEKCTVKAIAIEDGAQSPVATQNLWLNEVNSVAAFIENANPGATLLAAELNVLYQNGRYLYLKDANSYILSYNQSDLELGKFTNGQKLASITGSYKLQNSVMPEIIPTAVGAVSEGNPVKPETMTIAEINTGNVEQLINHFVKLEGVNIVATERANNYTFSQGENTLVAYNQFNNANYYDLLEIPEGEGFTVEGFIGYYNNAIQFNPTKVEGGTVMETVETPVFTPTSGSELKEGAEITIACATAGATIYYTTDGSDPANGGTEYTQPIKFAGDAMTVKAIATKADMLDSNMATATYTAYVEGSSKATFDFGEDGNVTTLTTSDIEANNVQTADGKNNLSGVMFNNSPLTLLLLKNSSNTTPRWWGTGTIKPELRVYANNEITVAVSENGYKLSSVEFTRGTAAATNFNALDVTATTNLGEGQEGTWDKETKTWTAPNGIVNNVVFTVTANARMCGITAVYVADPNATAAGIEGIAAENNADAPVEYYNLQGVRVNGENLSNGIYIRRQGSDVSKVYIVR